MTRTQALTRRELLFATASSLQASSLQARRRRPPNIVFIMADDLGIGDLGCYGQDKIRTPNIDRIAKEGMRFTNAYSGCTVCAPSRSVLMTGYHMGHTSIRGNTGGQSLAPADVTVAQVLKQAGYATGGFGKWGLGDYDTDGAPWKKGFDKFFGYLHQVHAHYFYPKFLMDNDRRHPLAGNENGKRVTFSHDVIAQQALGFIEQNAARPFFCYVPFTIPHWELLVPEDSFKEYQGKFGPEPPYVDKSRHYADQPEPKATYAAMITRMDRDIGRILDLLDRLKLTENTIVFFTSDNGAALRLLPIEGLRDYFRSTMGLRGHKQNVYEGGIRTPMLARWPGRIKPGVVSDHQWSFCDVMPTLCDIAGTPAPKGIDGVSVAPTLFGKGKQRQPDYLYWELPRYNAKEQAFLKEAPMQALRKGDWKILRPKQDAALELYNLKSDPYEERDLAGSEPRKLAELSALLAKARTEPRPLASLPAKYWEE
jgi:arylsulfatase A-like enzyme